MRRFIREGKIKATRIGREWRVSQEELQRYAHAELANAPAEPRPATPLSLISTAGLAPQRRSFIYKALPLALLGDWGLRRINKMVCGDVELPPQAEEFMALAGRHFRPLLEPVPLFSDDELRRLQMPIQLFAGSNDMLLHAAASVERLVRLLPHAEAHLLEYSGHAILGKSEEILRFLVPPCSTATGGAKGRAGCRAGVR